MSGNYTQVDTEQVMNLVSHALPIVDSMEATRTLIANEGKELANSWEAPISTQYQSCSVPKLDKNLETFLANYKDFIENLRALAAEYNQQEDETYDLIVSV